MSMYAQFCDEPDQPGLELETTTAHSDSGATAEARISTKPNISPVTSQSTSASRSLKCTMNKSTVIFAAVLGVVFCFTVANFALLMLARSDTYFQLKVKDAILTMSKTDTAKIRGLCSLTYRNKCFFAIHRSGVEFSDARRLCASKDATLANVYSKRHLDMIGAHLKQTRVGPGPFAWVGMTYNATEDRIYWNNGSEVTYDVQWYIHAGYPTTATQHDKMAIHYDLTAEFNGFTNEKPNKKLNGVVCEVN